MRIIFLSAAVSIFFLSCNTIQKKHTDDIPLTEAEVNDFIRGYDAM